MECLGETSLQVRIRDSNVNVQLYDGYDWAYTRRTIENEVKEMRKRLAKIRQLMANGQTQETDPEETSAVLFNSVYIGLQQDVNELEPDALVAAIDEELKIDLETASQGSWQTLPAPSSKPASQTTRTTSRRLTRSRGSSIEFQVLGLNASFDQYRPSEQLVSKVFATVENLEILDHIKTSTRKKLLTALRSDSRGNIRETGSSMVRAELRTLRPVVDDPSEENRLRAYMAPRANPGKFIVTVLWKGLFFYIHLGSTTRDNVDDYIAEMERTCWGRWYIGVRRPVNVYVPNCLAAVNMAKKYLFRKGYRFNRRCPSGHGKHTLLTRIPFWQAPSLWIDIPGIPPLHAHPATRRAQWRLYNQRFWRSALVLVFILAGVTTYLRLI
ncbi:autophagy-related protein 2 [Marasmius crinis-equi]|uniref:Autophagy-related protein 2 n=1 Tax=Marasmius crinis-equi TaxID=585013 RepID=A0ABR3F072_9AGAR